MIVDNSDKDMSCRICQKKIETRLINNISKDAKSYDIYFCEACSIGYTIPPPTYEELSGLYSSGSYRTEEGKRFNHLIELFIYLSRLMRKKRVNRLVKKGRILDIGCGRGLFLDIMKRDGWAVTGVEFNKETASYASEVYGIKVITESSIDTLHDESFDVITINHVLEHSQRPAELISECKRLLKRRGLLVIAIPNIFSLQASSGNKVWFHLDLPFHINHFSEKGVSLLLKKYSFSIFKSRQFDLEHNPFGWLQTLLNLSGIKENLFYNLLKSSHSRSNELINTSKRDLVLTLLLLPVYFPLSFILAVFESLLKRGGTTEVYAVKE